jgi:peptidoglycan/xylan/chitin deacetylase (PgdA/CDA1 family)
MRLIKKIINFLFRILKTIKKRIATLRYGSCAVLLYHRVVDLNTDPQLLAVSPVNFEKHLKILKSKYNILSVSEFENLIFSSKRFPKNSVVITFDDGYVDNYVEVMPLLEKYEAQAIFYISTGNIGNNQEFWWDEIERLFLLSTPILNSLIIETNNNSFNIINSDSINNESLYNQLLPILRSISVPERNEIISKLTTQFNSLPPRISHRSMNIDELKLFSRSSSVVIGAHTQNHPSLAALNESDQLFEIESSKIFLEKLTGKSITHFSYPFGTVKDYNSTTESICKKLGFNYVAANYPFLVNAKTSKFNFPRFLVRDWDEKQFEKEIIGFFKN